MTKGVQFYMSIHKEGMALQNNMLLVHNCQLILNGYSNDLRFVELGIVEMLKNQSSDEMTSPTGCEDVSLFSGSKFLVWECYLKQRKRKVWEAGV